ncbi:MAG TPA: hypothetical protein VMN37_11720 [Gemmatimonadales bacterium]|nr:hypothetical protein [Gemmatimonadales bacterium]
MTAVTGFEQPMVDTLLELLPGAARDRAGNAVRAGGSAPRRLAVCGLDEPGWVVGRVRPDGWLTLRRSPGPPAPMRDQQLEGARVTVFGRRGPVPGVVAVRSIHLTRGRDELSTGPFTVDSALVDLGAASAEAVARLGVEVLSVVSLAKRPHRYGADLLAAPHAGRRAACAALAHAAAAGRPDAAVVVFAGQQELSGRGLAAAARVHGPFEETIVVGGIPGAAAGVLRGDDPQLAARVAGLGRVTRLSLPVRYPGSAVETVALSDVRALAEEIAVWLRSGR